MRCRCPQGGVQRAKRRCEAAEFLIADIERDYPGGRRNVRLCACQEEVGPSCCSCSVNWSVCSLVSLTVGFQNSGIDLAKKGRGCRRRQARRRKEAGRRWSRSTHHNTGAESRRLNLRKERGQRRGLSWRARAILYFYQTGNAKMARRGQKQVLKRLSRAVPCQPQV